LAAGFAAHGQSVVPIYSFDGTNGGHPYASLALGPDGNFYGTALNGGSNGQGTVFQATTNGGFATLATFDGTNGASPYAVLALGPDNNFYGVASGGGDGNFGADFELTTNGVFAPLASFGGGTNGASPIGGLALGPDGNFYGTTYGGGGGYGTVFRMTTNGALTTLVQFSGTNGAWPNAGLTLGPDGNFYGLTYAGGANLLGTVFQVTTNGVLTTLVNFSGTNGASPQASLTLGADGNLYGTAAYGGNTNLDSGLGYGTVFQLTLDGTLTTLVNFDGTNGAWPQASLALGPDGEFYGTTDGGLGSSGGTVFRMTTNGSLTTLANLTSTSGDNPYSGLTLGADGNFYGTAFSGGEWGYGTIYQLELAPDFIASPANAFASDGGTATFGCQPFGEGPYGYQWLSNGVPVAGATGSSLTVSNAFWQTATNVQYQVVVANAFGSVTSGVAMIIPGLMIEAQPADQTVAIGSPAVFAPVIGGARPLACWWYFNGGVLAGATNTTLLISPALTNEIGTYQLVVTNFYGNVTSRLASLDVVLQPNSYAVSRGSANNGTVYVGSYPGSTNRLWATTNLMHAPWQVIGTCIMDTNGLAQFVDTNRLRMPRKYYRLSYP
jgi:uncharacterized repeat protein (TIGR03803 family)